MEKRWFFIYLLCFFLFAETLSWWTAEGLGPCLVAPEHSEQVNHDNQQQDCPTFFAGSLLVAQRGFEWIKTNENDKAVVAGFTIVLAISTIGLWLATIDLYRAGETQRLLAEDTAQRQLRAYVSVESGESFRPRKGANFAFAPRILNNGATPAVDVRVSSRMGLVRPPVPSGFDYPLLDLMDMSVSTVGPNQGRGHLMLFFRPTTIAERRAIARGDLLFHVYGTIFYKDVFKKDRTTNFSMLISVPSKRHPCRWNYTNRHNDAT